MPPADEMFEVYDRSGRPLGLRPRSECHGNPELIHRTCHVVVFDPAGGRILLQKRAASKDVQPGKWDTAVGGHLRPGEDYAAGARREAAEELGLAGPLRLETLFDLQIRNRIESEDVRVFAVRAPGPFAFQREEIDEVRFFTFDELRDPVRRAEFTPNLRVELDRILENAGGNH